jgi:signal transduction histidine kinase
MTVRGVDPDLADLVHDLGNPAAAAQSASRHLALSLVTMADLALAPFDAAAREALEALRLSARGPRRDDDPTRRAAREIAIAAWLGARRVPEAPRRARELSRAGVSVEALDRHLGGSAESALTHAIGWLETACACDASLALLDTACRRLNDHLRALRGRTLEALVDLHVGLDGAIAIATRDRDQIAVDRSFAQDVPRIPGDAVELDRVFSNIVHNAVDALGGAGRIWLRTSVEPGFARIEVANDGPPIPADLVDRIFERSFTTKREEGGSGLGLAICKRIIEEHGGTLTVSSIPGRTAFFIRLPLASPETSS